MGRSHIEACVCGVRAGQCHRNPLSTDVAARWCSNGVEKPPAKAGGFPYAEFSAYLQGILEWAIVDSNH
jgi:hypothetical protein